MAIGVAAAMFYSMGSAGIGVDIGVGIAMWLAIKPQD